LLSLKNIIILFYIDLLGDRTAFHALSASPLQLDKQLFLLFDACIQRLKMKTFLLEDEVYNELAGLPEGTVVIEKSCRRVVMHNFGPIVHRAYMRRWLRAADRALVGQMAEHIRGVHWARLFRERMTMDVLET
jgi:hypothetical protein